MCQRFVIRVLFLPQATQVALSDFADDNVVYVELRSGPKANENMTKEQYLEAMIKGVERASDRIQCRLIASFDRKKGLEEAQSTLKAVYAVRGCSGQSSSSIFLNFL